MDKKIIPFPGKWEGSTPPPGPLEITRVSIHPDGDLKFIRRYKILAAMHGEYDKPFTIPYVDLRTLMNDKNETDDAKRALVVSFFSSIKQFFKKFGEGEIHVFQYDIINDTWKDEHIILEMNFDLFVEKMNLWTLFGYYRNGKSICVAGFFGVDYEQEDAGRIMQPRTAISWFEDTSSVPIDKLPKADLDALISHIHYQIDMHKVCQDFDD